MMWPEPCSVICERKTVLLLTGPRRLVSSIQVQSLLEMRSSLPCRSTPAALTRMSTRPIVLTASRASERTDASLRTSVDSAMAASLVPSLTISATVRSIRGVSKSAITMFAPCLAIALATARLHGLDRRRAQAPQLFGIVYEELDHVVQRRLLEGREEVRGRRPKLVEIPGRRVEDRDMVIGREPQLLCERGQGRRILAHRKQRARLEVAQTEAYCSGKGGCHHDGWSSMVMAITHLTQLKPRAPGTTRRRG